MVIRKIKSEYRNTPDFIKWVETISNNKNSNDQKKKEVHGIDVIK